MKNPQVITIFKSSPSRCQPSSPAPRSPGFPEISQHRRPAAQGLGDLFDRWVKGGHSCGDYPCDCRCLALWWLMMGWWCIYLWWVYEGWWWLMMVYDGLRWFTVVYDGVWWFMYADVEVLSSWHLNWAFSWPCRKRCSSNFESCWMFQIRHNPHTQNASLIHWSNSLIHWSNTS